MSETAPSAEVSEVFETEPEEEMLSLVKPKTTPAVEEPASETEAEATAEDEEKEAPLTQEELEDAEERISELSVKDSLSAGPGRFSRHKKRDSVGDVLLLQMHSRSSVGSPKHTSLSQLSEVSDDFYAETSKKLQDMQGVGEGNGWGVMIQFLDAIHRISSQIEPEQVASTIISETCALLKCDRSSLFFVDADANELILVVAAGANNIRLPIGKGIAGSVALSGNTENIIDAYQDDRFSSAFDKSSGYRTGSILATVVRDPSGEIVAVLQCINKKGESGENDGTFSRSDEILLENMASHTGVVLRNAKLYESERSAKAKVSSLLDIVKMLHSVDTSTHSLIFTLSNRAHVLVDADRGTLFLVDQVKEQLVVMQGDVDIRIPKTTGIAGQCATNGVVLNIPDAYKDERFSKAVDMKTGYRTKSILCMPIFGKLGVGGEKGAVIGVLQCINKMDDADVFGANDQDLLETLLKIAGPILESSKFFKPQKKLKEMDMARGIRGGVRNTAFKPSLGGLGSFAE